MTDQPQPRKDADGVPWCTYKCDHAKRISNNRIHCTACGKIRDIGFRSCIPAVREMAGELEEKKKALADICGPYDIEHVNERIESCSCEECSLPLLDLLAPPRHVICEDCATSELVELKAENERLRRLVSRLFNRRNANEVVKLLLSDDVKRMIKSHCDVCMKYRCLIEDDYGDGCSTCDVMEIKEAAEEIEP